MPTLRDDAPLIVTAQLDKTSFAILDGLRRRYFPPALNKVPAHVSLFHHLPGHEVDQVVADVTAECAGREHVALLPTGLRFLGRGVAIAYEASAGDDLRRALANRWARWLTVQDRQPFQPHVTIQNKVAPDTARATLERLGEQELPSARIEGVSVWRYRGGPWEPVTVVPLGDV